MRVTDKVVIVTGAASGIGRAMAERFAAERAKAVVLADLDADGAAAVAASVGEHGSAVAVPVACDVTDPAQISAVISLAMRDFGAVDLYCANAGVGVGAGLDTADEVWDVAFDVNVRAHIVAARLLMPAWLARGRGYFLATASAAGLLSLIGSAPYTVTKHAAVAFAEWLAITYRGRGIGVSCLCPMGVRTPLLENGFARPDEAGAGLRVTNAAAPLLDPAEVAEHVVDGLAAERFLILPHPQVHELVAAKAADRDAWLKEMSRLSAISAAAGPAPRAPASA